MCWPGRNPHFQYRHRKGAGAFEHLRLGQIVGPPACSARDEQEPSSAPPFMLIRTILARVLPFIVANARCAACLAHARSLLCWSFGVVSSGVRHDWPSMFFQLRVVCAAWDIRYYPGPRIQLRLVCAAWYIYPLSSRPQNTIRPRV